MRKPSTGPQRASVIGRGAGRDQRMRRPGSIAVSWRSRQTTAKRPCGDHDAPSYAPSRRLPPSLATAQTLTPDSTRSRPPPGSEASAARAGGRSSPRKALRTQRPTPLSGALAVATPTVASAANATAIAGRFQERRRGSGSRDAYAARTICQERSRASSSSGAASRRASRSSRSARPDDRLQRALTAAAPRRDRYVGPDRALGASRRFARSSRPLPDQFAERVEPAAQPRVHRAAREVERVRYLPRRELEHVAHHDDGALLDAEPHERRGDRVADARVERLGRRRLTGGGRLDLPPEPAGAR